MQAAVDPGAAQWAFDKGQPAGSGTDTLAGSAFLYLPLHAPMRTRGVLAIRPQSRRLLLVPEQKRQLDTFAALAAIALERVHYVEVAQQALLRMESERLRNSLLAALSHDLRTPLAALIGLAESLTLTRPRAVRPAAGIGAGDRRRSAPDERARQQPARHGAHPERRGEAAPRMAAVRGSGRQRAQGSARCRSARHRVETDLDPALPLVEFDATLIERVLYNLLENAGKYTPDGTLIRLEAAVSGDNLRVTISDNGPGLPKGQEESIFEKFTRGTRESTTPGVGLGLAISRAIVEAHGGRIWAEDNPGGGARFCFTLPLGTPPATPPEEAGSCPADGRDAMTEPAPTALLIEDERQIRRFVRTAMETEGWQVVEAETMKQGLIDAGTRKPDLVVLDLGLPDGNGIDFIRDFRGWSSVPVIVLSARADETDKIEALDAGADDYLTKPFGVGELLARVRATLRRKAASAPGSGGVFRFGDVEVDQVNRVVTRDGVQIHLTPIEYRLLTLLDRQCRQGAHPPPPAARGLGSELRREQPLCAHLRRPPAAEARGRCRAAAPPADRNRRRLPLPALTPPRSNNGTPSSCRRAARPKGKRLAVLDAVGAGRRVRRHRHQPALRAEGGLRRRAPSGADQRAQHPRDPLARVLVADDRRVDQVRRVHHARRQQGRRRHHGADGAGAARSEGPRAGAGPDAARACSAPRSSSATA